jgi:D-beta-D-heptose 7-phosphate kinase/D-beta-D-heptose 1-phosphate adenosyltransferase
VIPSHPDPTDWPAVVAAFAGRRLLVVGDVMLDRYVSGDARRVCPEAPVPVVEAVAKWSAPGGAANAAANAAALGGRVMLGGAVGDDPEAGELARLIRSAGVEPAGLITDSSRPTTTKLRILARGQQIVRVDTESVEALPARPTGQLVAWVERVLGNVDAVLLSDYAKGVGSLAPRMIESARRVGRPVVVDPKGPDAARYLGATVLKPNLTELANLAQIPVRAADDVGDAAVRVIEMLPGTAILVTQGPDGMTLFRAGRAPSVIRANPARQVSDVTGAGDTAAAALALALAAELPIETASRLANAAAGVAVCKVGTASVTPAELVERLR